MERSRRADEKSLRAGSQSLRFQRRHRQCDRSQLRHGRHRHRNRRQHHLPVRGRGLVGIKPTVGLVSRSGIIPISHSQDTAGPMARNVADAALAVDGDRRVAMRPTMHSAQAGRPDTPDYTRASSSQMACKGARIGVAAQAHGLPARCRRGDGNRDRSDARQPAPTVVDAEIPTLGQWDDAECTVLLYEFKTGPRKAYLADSDAPIRTLAGLIEFDKAARRHRDAMVRAGIVRCRRRPRVR